MTERGFLIAGGGTGGHVFPALALAGEIRRRRPGAPIVFVGTARGLETTLVPKAGFPLELVRAKGLVGKGWRARLDGLRTLPLAFLDSLRLLARHAPRAVVGVGGYASGPLVTTAWARRIPTLIHEQNAIPGLTNRILARLARRIAVGTVRGAAALPGAIVTGNPVRPAFFEIPSLVSRSKERRLRVLVVGGSQGAEILNRLMPGALARVAARGIAFDVVHQAGKGRGIRGRRSHRGARGRDDRCGSRGGRTPGPPRAVRGRDAWASGGERAGPGIGGRRCRRHGGGGDGGVPGGRSLGSPGRPATAPRDGRGRAPFGGAGCGLPPVRSSLRSGGRVNFLRVKRLHFVGIGGIGMCGLAELLKSVGLEVTGSDLALGETSERLVGLGIKVHQGHRAENVAGADVVVVLPCVPAIAMPRLTRMTSASISARLITGIPAERAAATSALLSWTALE